MSTVILGNESNAEYHMHDGYVSSSGIRTLADSPLKYHAEYIERRVVREETPAMAMGTALHTLMLEPEKFDGQYVSVPDGIPNDRRYKAFKDWEFSLPPDVRVLTSAEMYALDRMRRSLFDHPLIEQLLETPGEVERSLRWIEDNGVKCKIRPDKLILSTATKICVDLKTTQQCTVSDFEKSIGSYGYDLQCAFYLRGLQKHYSGEWKFLFPVVEKSEPYRCRLFEIEDDSLLAAQEKVESLINELKRRVNEDYWLEPNQYDVVKVRTPFYRLSGYQDNE